MSMNSELRPNQLKFRFSENNEFTCQRYRHLLILDTEIHTHKRANISGLELSSVYLGHEGSLTLTSFVGLELNFNVEVHTTLLFTL